jgi:ABC-type lipoprotein release transport system permease subunit
MACEEWLMPEPMKKTSFSSTAFWLVLTALGLAATFGGFRAWVNRPVRSSQQGEVQIQPKDFAAVAAGVDAGRMEKSVRDFTALGSRLSGSPGCDAAATELKRQLSAILGEENVRAESFAVDNPFDLGTELVAGKDSFRIHPFWAPVVGSYRLPAQGRDLGQAYPTSLGGLLAAPDLKGKAAIVDFPTASDVRMLVQAAHGHGLYDSKALTPAEEHLLSELQSDGRASRPGDEQDTLDAIAVKSQVLLADFALKRWQDSGVQSLLFLMPQGVAERVPAHSFADRILKHPSPLPRYLISHDHAATLIPGEALRVRQAPASLTFLEGRGRDQSQRIYPLWPNVVRTASTPADGLEGRLVWAGHGGLEELKGKVLDSCIALVDFNCGYNWVGLADLGAKAILFAEPENVLRGEAENKYLSVPANIPRYWVSKKQAEALKAREGERIRLDAQVVWEHRQADNVVARLAGKEPGGWDAPVVLEAHYDSVSVVPDLAPGGEQACGPAALLELARVLKAHPLKKPVLFVLCAGHSQNMLGWREYLWKHDLNPQASKTPDAQGWLEGFKPAFVVDLDLTTRSRRLAAFFKADSFNALEDLAHTTYGNFGFAHADACQAAASALGYGDDFFADAINPAGGLRWHDYLPGKFALAQELTLHAGLYGVAYATPDDERVLVDTPLDLPGSMDFESLAEQTKVLACALPNVLNVNGAFATSEVMNYWNNLKARVVEFDPRVAYLPDRSVQGAMVWVHSVKVPSKSFKGVRGQHFVQAVANAEQGGALMEIHGLPHNEWQANDVPVATLRCEAFELDPVDGSIRYAPDQGSQGEESYAMQYEATQQRVGTLDTKDLMLVTFPCRSLLFFDLVDPLNYKPFNHINVLDARTDSPPLVFGSSLPFAQDTASFVEPLAMAYAAEGTKVKATFASSALGQRGALLNSTDANPEGEGYLVGHPDSLRFTSLRMADDLWRLNQFRLDRMKRHGISNTYLDGLHAQAASKLKESQDALKTLDYQSAVAAARAAWGLSARVYPDVKATASDVVQSAMLFLALLIPFAYLAERLLVGKPEASQQVAWVGAIFLAVFLILRAVHPAFQIALTPVMILLSFIIIALSVILSSLIGTRFFDFLRETREQMQGVHQSEVSRVSLALAAFSIGVSNMRKRPLRTFLTCLTVVVLTFAVLSLTSVLQALKQKKFSLDKPAPYSGLLFRDPKWANLNDPALGRLKTELSQLGTLTPRAWFNPGQNDPLTGLEVLYQYRKRANAAALLGLKAEEAQVTGVSRTVKAGQWLLPEDRQACLLPDNLAEALSITAQDVGKASVSMFGVPFTVRGIFDSKAFQDIHDLDDEELVPVNFQATQQRDHAQSSQDAKEGQLPSHYLHRDAGQMVILPYDTLMRLGGTLASIAVPMASADRIQNSIRDLLNRLGLLVYVGVNGKTFAYSAVGGTTTGGLDDLLVPVLIAALIIFSTMLGAVQERKREIGVFSSVGLAPNHVAVLFLAEACVYAILGAAVGYLIGQGFSQLVSHGLVFQGLNVNYSSNAAVMAVVIVMAVVLASTLYPASLASKLARPSQAVDFTLPPMTGDDVSLDLPFSFNARDAQAVCAFLGEYFHAHGEASAGEFSTENIQLRERMTDDGKRWEMSARVWLAPYDFGVSQDLTFQTQEGVGHVSSARLTIHRLSGDQSSWYRVNGRFLKDIRKQFLIWRSLGESSRNHYQKDAATQMRRSEPRTADLKRGRLSV